MLIFSTLIFSVNFSITQIFYGILFLLEKYLVLILYTIVHLPFIL